MGFVLDGLETEAYDRTYRDRDLLLRIAAYLRPVADLAGVDRRDLRCRQVGVGYILPLLKR